MPYHNGRSFQQLVYPVDCRLIYHVLTYLTMFQKTDVSNLLVTLILLPRCPD